MLATAVSILAIGPCHPHRACPTDLLAVRRPCSTPAARQQQSATRWRRLLSTRISSKRWLLAGGSAGCSSRDFGCAPTLLGVLRRWQRRCPRLGEIELSPLARLRAFASNRP